MHCFGVQHKEKKNTCCWQGCLGHWDALYFEAMPSHATAVKPRSACKAGLHDIAAPSPCGEVQMDHGNTLQDMHTSS